MKDRLPLSSTANLPACIHKLESEIWYSITTGELPLRAWRWGLSLKVCLTLKGTGGLGGIFVALHEVL